MSIYNVGLIHQGRNQATYIFKCIELKIFRFCSTKIQASLKMFAHTHTHRNTGTYLMEERKLENYVDMREMKKFRCLFSEIWMIWHSQECFLSHSIVRCTNRMESQWFEMIYLLKGYLKSRDRTDCENRSIYWATLCHRLELVQHWTWLTSAKLNIKCLSSFKWIENRMHIQIKLEIIFHQFAWNWAHHPTPIEWTLVGWVFILYCVRLLGDEFQTETSNIEQTASSSSSLPSLIRIGGILTWVLWKEKKASGERLEKKSAAVPLIPL